MQDGKPIPTEKGRKARIKNIIIVCVIITIWITGYFISEYYAPIDSPFSPRRAQREMFTEHLKSRYAGTYYDGEFVVDGEITGGMGIGGSSRACSTYAYRADIPDLKFIIGGTINLRSTSDYFLETYIAWEGANALGDIITGIYGDEILYQVGTGLSDEAMLQRNGYADIVAHYKEDGSYPYIQIVVFTDEFDIEKATTDAVELYNAVVLGKREERFEFDIAYTNSDDMERGARYELSSITSKYSFDEPNNPYPTFYVFYVEEREGRWQDNHKTLFEFFSGKFRNFNK